MPDDALLTLIAETLLIAPDRVGEDAGMGVTENWDSLRNMMIMMEIERACEMKIAFRDYIDAATVTAIRALIAKARQKTV